jgi:signal transduction histidine kinase
MRFWRGWTIRTRLTALYALAFFIAGAILIAVTHFSLVQALDHRPGSGLQAVVQRFASERGLRDMPRVDSFFTAVNDQAEQERLDTLRTMRIRSWTSLLVVGMAACGFGWVLAGRALRPLADVTATARRVAGRSLHERIALRGPHDEIKELADTFDAMLERLERAFDGQNRFVANASHELRTPLAINRTLIEVAMEDPAVPDSTRQLGETLLAVNQRQERLIDGLLVLASSEQSLGVRSPVDLADVAHRAVLTVATEAEKSGIEISSELSKAIVTGDPALLERLVQNLVENAVRHNVGQGGWLHVQVDRRDGVARLAIQNSGPPIATSAVASLFEPFRRLAVSPGAAKPRGGAGLGLSIVRSVTVAHGGRIRADARPEGGLAVEITLPAQG